MKNKKINYLNMNYEIIKTKYFDILYIPKNTKKFYLDANFLCGSKDNVYYKNGKKVNLNSGITHFVEHLLFSLQNSKVNDYNNMGIEINGSTSFMGTSYYICAPTNQILKDNKFLILFEIIGNLKYNQKLINREKKIILEEANLEYETKDYKIETILLNLFYNEGLKKPIIGIEEELKKITKDEIINFFEAFYNKDNMLITMMGKLNTKQIQTLVLEIDNYFDNISKFKYNILNLNTNAISKISENAKLSNNVINLKYKIKSFDIFQKHKQYVVKINSSLDIFTLNTALNLLLNLFDETFNINYHNFLKKYKIDISSIEIWYKNYNNKDMFLFIEVQNYPKINKNIIKELLNILTTKISLQYFNLIKQHEKLNSLELLDQCLEVIANDYISQILFYVDKKEEYNKDLNLNFLTYEQIIMFQNNISFDLNIVEFDCLEL